MNELQILIDRQEKSQEVIDKEKAEWDMSEFEDKIVAEALRKKTWRPMPKHSRSIARVYKDSLLKRIRRDK